MSELKFVSFSSGSSGNCYFIGNEEDGILIDAGVSLRRLKQYLIENHLSFDSFSAILVTHDHMDHIRSLGSYCKKLVKPIYATSVLHDALVRRNFAVPYMDACRKVLADGEWNAIGPFLVKYFIVPHDATQTVGYAIRYQDRKFVLMTDMGRMTEEAMAFAMESDTVVIESNYDVDMLLAGPYTHELKMRICQGHGHLSNDECGMAIRKFYHPGLKNLFLCHLSDHNNTPEIAYKNAQSVLDALGVERGTVHLRALPRTSPTPLINL